MTRNITADAARVIIFGYNSATSACTTYSLVTVMRKLAFTPAMVREIFTRSSAFVIFKQSIPATTFAGNPWVGLAGLSKAAFIRAMVNFVRGYRRYKFKILKAIILFVAVFVVNKFSLVKRTAKKLTHNIAMLINKAMTGSVRMFWCIDLNIAVTNSFSHTSIITSTI